MYPRTGEEPCTTTPDVEIVPPTAPRVGRRGPPSPVSRALGQAQELSLWYRSTQTNLLSTNHSLLKGGSESMFTPRTHVHSSRETE